MQILTLSNVYPVRRAFTQCVERLPPGWERGELRSTLLLTLTVKNSGEPIAPEQLPRLFDRFYRVDEARDRQRGGYGLGLAIAREIVRAHGGGKCPSQAAMQRERYSPSTCLAALSRTEKLLRSV